MKKAIFVLSIIFLICTNQLFAQSILKKTSSAKIVQGLLNGAAKNSLSRQFNALSSLQNRVPREAVVITIQEASCCCAQSYQSKNLVPGTSTIKAARIEKMPYINIEDMISATNSNIHQLSYGRSVQISGGR